MTKLKREELINNPIALNILSKLNIRVSEYLNLPSIFLIKIEFIVTFYCYSKTGTSNAAKDIQILENTRNLPRAKREL